MPRMSETRRTMRLVCGASRPVATSSASAKGSSGITAPAPRRALERLGAAEVAVDPAASRRRRAGEPAHRASGTVEPGPPRPPTAGRRRDSAALTPLDHFDSNSIPYSLLDDACRADRSAMTERIGATGAVGPRALDECVVVVTPRSFGE